MQKNLKNVSAKNSNTALKSEKEIDNKTLEILNERYPNDLAKGYKMGDFRGAWESALS